MVAPLEHAFPKLRPGNYQITSPADTRYNCIAWSAGDTFNWWWPFSTTRAVTWPAGVAKEETLIAFEAAFASLGYTASATEELEAGMEKVALFANEQGFPTHGARQLANGMWTSKLGNGEDIEHALRDLEGDLYGTVVVVLKRPRST
jgi:hypothetical protein